VAVGSGMGQMRISVVTVVRNCVDTIADNLRSVASQRHPAVEHVVIDGASTDGTRALLERHRHALGVLVSEPDRGIYDAMNKGIAASRGDVIGTLNADDVYADDRVLADVAAAFVDPTVEACFGDLVYVDRRDAARVVRYWRSRPFEPGSFRRGWMPAHPTFFVRRQVYERHGLFDLRFRLQADFELTMRLLEVARIRSAYLPRVLVRMRMGGATNRSVKNVVLGNLEAYRACRMHRLGVTPFFMVRKVLSRIPQFFARPLPAR
jgi:glycosyltransferase involved in cell wall biosynthesis